MSQLTDQLLKANNLPIMGPMNQNYNLINNVTMPQLLQNQSNMPTSNTNNTQRKSNQTKSQNGNPQESK